MIIHECEQNTPEWEALRAGIPTTSAFSSIITGTGKPADSASIKKYARLLAAEEYCGHPLQTWTGSYHTKRGHEIEPEAGSYYDFIRDTEIMKVGFVTDDNERYGCSPDAFVLCNGLLEIKCLSHEEHVSIITYFNKHGKAKPGYNPQAQGQLFVCEKDWVDQLFYHPDLPSLIIRQNADKEYHREIKKQLAMVLNEREKYKTELINYENR